MHAGADIAAARGSGLGTDPSISVSVTRQSGSWKGRGSIEARESRLEQVSELPTLDECGENIHHSWAMSPSPFKTRNLLHHETLIAPKPNRESVLEGREQALRPLHLNQILAESNPKKSSDTCH